MTYQPMYDLSDIINDQNDLDGKSIYILFNIILKIALLNLISLLLIRID